MISASVPAEPPFGGITPLPLMALAVRPSIPCARRGAHAALSPSFGAFATPLKWQVWQICVYNAGAVVAATATTAAAAAAGAVLAVVDAEAGAAGVDGAAGIADAAGAAGVAAAVAPAAGVFGSSILAPAALAM